MDRDTQIRAFTLIAKKGSLAAAAAEEGVTPVIMGRRLDALEKRLGIKLMHRTTRRLSLTEPGTEFLDQCRRILAELDEAEKAVSAGRNVVRGHLIVSAPAAFGRKHVAPHAPAFLEQHPEVQLSFNLTDRPVDIVREGYDLAIRIGQVSDPNYVAVKLYPNRRVVCGTPEYFERHGTPRRLEDLVHHNCLAFNLQGGQNRGWFFVKDGLGVAVRVSGNLDCNDGELLYRWVKEGRGIGWRSLWEIEGELARGELVTVLDEFAVPAYDIQAVYAHQSYLPAKVSTFIQYLKGIYNAPGYWSDVR